MPEVSSVSINTIRTLCMDAVQQAKSGHPGTPMAMAPVVYTLWQDYLRFDPEDPIWPNRDRFILSAGHASTLLYALLHLAGVKAVNRKYENLGELAVTIEDLKKFRQLESKCPSPRVPLDIWSGDHHGPIRPRSGHQRGHRTGRQVAG
jgi:transketolase